MGPAACSVSIPIHELIPTFLRADAIVLPTIIDDELNAPVPSNDASDAVLEPLCEADADVLTSNDDAK